MSHDNENKQDSKDDNVPEKNSDNTQNKQPEINPWGSQLVGEEDYVRLSEEFGIEQIMDLSLPASIYDNFRSLRRKIIFGHRDFGYIAKAMRDGKPWAVISGIKPSGKFHLGTMLTAVEMIDLQKLGGKLYYAIADIESYEDNGMNFDVAYKNAIDNLADMLALGMDPDNAYVWLQSRETLVKEMPFKLGRYVTNAMIKAIYGDKPFGLYLSALVQVGDILLPQLKDGIMPTVVPVGIDQDPHLRLTRDMSKYFKINGEAIFKPSATYHKLMPGIDDISKKMNKSRPNSYFYFDEEPKAIKKKIMNAFTGGRRNKEEQLKMGGVPERCMIYKILEFLFESDDKALQERYIKCKSGGLLCGTCKKEVSQKILSFIEEHNKKKKELIPVAEKLLRKNEA
ncbi:MAG: tryptophan--tRNA ligase [Promethearchaeota archaeon]